MAITRVGILVSLAGKANIGMIAACVSQRLYLFGKVMRRKYFLIKIPIIANV